MQSPEMEHGNDRDVIDSGQLAAIQNGKLANNTHDFGGVNSLEKVREILFGNQLRDVEKKFARLEERLLKECLNSREENKKRLDNLENYIKQELESLSKRMKQEQGNREETLHNLAEENKKITTALENKLNQFDEHVNNSQREMREQILNQSKNLHDDMLQKYAEILEILRREAEELRHAKTDRSTLANLLSELAIRLNSQ
jgi:DNA anti-recombination protein RmuC